MQHTWQQQAFKIQGDECKGGRKLIPASLFIVAVFIMGIMKTTFYFL